MANLSGFNANEVDPNEGFDAVPAGEYPAIIIASELKATKAGTGNFLLLELQILRGKYQNRKLWDRLNLKNPNATAVQIGKGTLSAICRAVGVMEPKDSAELHNKPLLVKVAVKQFDGEDRNEVKGYKPMSESGTSEAEQMSEDLEKAPW